MTPNTTPTMTAEAADPIVGHKTMRDEAGNLYHEPLHASEADAIWRSIEAEEARRVELIPDEDAARRMFFDAWRRLQDFGWKEAIYCPKDGSPFEVIEAGSSGVHRCMYEGEWPSGRWWVLSNGDMWPSRPVLYRAIDSARKEREG